MLLRNFWKRCIDFIILGIILFFLCNTIALGKDQNILPIAIMIGNSPAEHEIQKGLSRADIIYEIAVEYPFTRLMAIFLNNNNGTVGPVRSSRYYFSRLCAEWSAIFAHCGGQSLKNSNIIDINELNYPAPYWRDEKIGGWINLFTSLSKLEDESQKIDSNKNKQQLHHPLLNFEKSTSSTLNQIHKISIKYHKDYMIRYEYLPAEKLYYRFINDEPHIDNDTNEQLKITNIILQTAVIEDIIGDDKGRVQVELVGEGLGRVFKEGFSQPVKWTKKSKDEQTFFLDSKDNTIDYRAGMTWVHILATDTEIWCK
jgi:hypothetical protein